MLPAEALSFATIRIECHTETAPRTGTGFFFHFGYDTGTIPMVITNRHVVEGATRAVLSITRADAEGNPERGSISRVDFQDLDKAWVPHPDPSVDLCALPWAHVLRAARAKGITPFFKSFNREMLPSADELTQIAAGDEVVMIGYPLGLSDSVNNMPIFRRGIAATHPGLDYEGSSEFVVDVACFPGSSGSPVIRYASGLNLDRNAIPVGGSLRLLGILHAVPMWRVKGKIEIVPIPTQMEPIPVSYIPINLGFVIKAERILEFEPLLQELAEKEREKSSIAKEHV